LSRTNLLPPTKSLGLEQLARAGSRCEFLHDRAHGHVLPGSWRTLYELTQLSRAQLEAAV
jgi:hypothetical protein